MQQATLEFFQNLKNHNEKPWFDANKSAYQAALKDFESLTGHLIEHLNAMDVDIVASHLQPKDCIMRIYRDVRFSADKTPYKTNFFAYMAKNGRKSIYAGYYFCLEPGDKSFSGGGIYMPMPPELAKVRQEIAYELAEWKTILSQPDFCSQFPQGLQTTEALSRPPKGYEADHPALEYLKNKSFYTMRSYTDAEICSPQIGDQIAASFKAVQPLVKFLNRAFD